MQIDVHVQEKDSARIVVELEQAFGLSADDLARARRQCAYGRTMAEGHGDSPA